jgi:5-methylcytosine-specific restriction endonuclease McrA
MRKRRKVVDQHTTEQCSVCGRTRRIWKSNVGRTNQCRRCQGRALAKRYAEARSGLPAGYERRRCVECGRERIARKDKVAPRCRSCAMRAAMTPARRRAMSKRFSGAGTNFWRGGLTRENKRLRQEARYRSWRRAVFIRDAYTCQDCGLIGGRLHPHHVKPWAKYPTLRYSVANGRTLCAACHRKTDTYGNRQHSAKARTG